MHPALGARPRTTGPGRAPAAVGPGTAAAWPAAGWRQCAGPAVAGRRPRPRWPAGWRHRQAAQARSEEHTSELQSHSELVCRLLLAKKQQQYNLEVELMASTSCLDWGSVDPGGPQGGEQGT